MKLKNIVQTLVCVLFCASILAGLVGGFGVIATDGEPLWLGLLVGALGCFLAAGALVGFCDEDENT